MSKSRRLDVTQLLRAWTDGDGKALEALTPEVYGELHRLAAHYMAGERPGHALQATALVNEAYLRLIDWKAVHWQNRAHFFAISAQLMRRILVDYARSDRYLKRGGGMRPLSLDESIGLPVETSDDVVALDDALCRLAKIDPRKSQIVELCLWGGLTVEEKAEVLKVSAMTVMRDWEFARAWLRRELAGDNGETSE